MNNQVDSETLQLAVELINKASITPADAGCQDTIMSRLSACEFLCETLQIGDVTNLWARRGTAGPLLCFAGHTDVVPPGALDSWNSDPFKAEVRDGHLFGRGAADMKGGVAAMVTAVERFVAATPSFDGSVAFLITSDEEGIAVNGTRAVINVLRQRGESIDYCVIGEPSSNEIPGDTIRIGRRGSLTASVRIAGKQGHVAYGHLAENPIGLFSPALAELNAIEWDQGNEHFPPTSFELVHLHSSSGTDNVIPAILDAKFNFRYSTEWTHERLQREVESLLTKHKLRFQINWHLSGEPFLTQPGLLTDAVVKAVKAVSGVKPELSTGGGTSDGRFISPAGADVVELGLVNATIHQVNENVEVRHLDVISEIYEEILGQIFVHSP